LTILLYGVILFYGINRINTLKTKLLIIIFFSITNVFASQKYFSQIQKTAKNYSVEINYNQIKSIVSNNGSVSLNIELTSNRNNFEMVMLVGYISAGTALKSGMKFNDVIVTVNVPLGDGFKLVTKSKITELKQLIDGKINTSQFVRKIEYLN